MRRIAVALLTLGALVLFGFTGHAQASQLGFHHSGLRQLTVSPDCTLRVPNDPRTAKGLATPYVLSSAGAMCSETNSDTAAFVQAVILDPATGQLSVYNPPVRDAGMPLLGTAPPVPVLPRHAVVSIWTGFNGNVLKLTGPGHDEFVNFAQQAYDNSERFFAAASMVTPPPLGVSPLDGMSCPSSRDFSIVDQDQSDNVVVSYPAYGVKNGSDEALTRVVDNALGCQFWTVPSLSSPGTFATAGQLLEMQAAAGQGSPVALVPGLDPFVLKANGSRSLSLQNLYRAQVDQPWTWNNSDTADYCANLSGVGEPRLKADLAIETAVPSSNGTGTNLANQLAGRFSDTWTLLTCDQLTGQPSPIQVTRDMNGVTTGATYA